MKKVKFGTKLNLGKETIAKLNHQQLGNVHGGGTKSWEAGCGNLSTVGPCYSMGTTCLPDTASCNLNSCPQAGSCPTTCGD